MSQCEAPDKPSNVYVSSVHPKITTQLKSVCTKNNLYVVLTNIFKITNFLKSSEDKTQVTRQKGVYQIPYDFGNYYVGRTYTNIKT